ncbi:MAG: MarR family transcriptional regulator [Gemmatimonadales bacterium]|nr:MAG: MarR family transcriptional regulator [Gemmatimonadales bacterium]
MLPGEIQQRRPFRSRAEEALLALLRTTDRVRSALGRVIESYGITPQQYNVLRILRGAEPEGLRTLAITERLIERAPGITRMIDRLEAKGLVGRERRGEDRRCVHVRITAKGLKLLEALDDPVDRADREAFSCLSRQELATLISLLDRVRHHNETLQQSRRRR